MQLNPLEGARAKMDRANFHLQQLDTEIKTASRDHKYGIRFVHERRTNQLVITALVPRDDFIRYSVIAGEIVGHARSALEHAVWNLVPNPIVRKTGFPVFVAKTK